MRNSYGKHHRQSYFALAALSGAQRGRAAIRANLPALALPQSLKIITSDLHGDGMPFLVPAAGRAKGPSPLTLVEMLDALEARLTALRVEDGHLASTPPPEPISDATLRAQMLRVGLSAADFRAIFGVAPDQWEDWMTGKSPIPSWVQTALQILVLLSPTARRSFLNRPGLDAQKAPAKTHPFSRIEEL